MTEFLIEEGDDELSEVLKSETPVRFSEMSETMLRELQDMVEEIGQTLKMRVRIHEYEVYGYDSALVNLGRKRRKNFLENDLLVALDPTHSQCAMMIEGASANPRQRVAAAFSNANDLYSKGRLLSVKKLPLFDELQNEQRRVIQRAFSMHLSPNEDQRAQDSDEARAILQKAMCYPHEPPNQPPAKRPQTVPRDHFKKLFIPE